MSLINCNLSGFQHLSFDLWLTLIKSDPRYKPERDAAFRNFFSISKPLETVVQVIRYYDLACNKIAETTGKHVKFTTIYLLILMALDVSISDDTVEKIKEFYVKSALLFRKYRPVLIHSDTQTVLSRLVKQQRTLSILSNTAFIEGRELRELLELYELGEFFSFQLYSDETQLAKPNRKFFEILQNNVRDLYRTHDISIVHIGDNFYADYLGAVNAGLSGHHVKI